MVIHHINHITGNVTCDQEGKTENSVNIQAVTCKKCLKALRKTQA